METCTKIGKKSLAVVCGMVLALLSALSLKGGKIASTVNTVLKAANPQRPLQGSHFGTPVARSQIPSHDPGPVCGPAQSVSRCTSFAEATAAGATCVVAAATGSSGDRHLNSLYPRARPRRNTQQKDRKAELKEARRLAELEEAIEKIKHQKQFKVVLDDIRNNNYRLSYLPHQLSGIGEDRNMLESMPKVVVQQILQFIFYGNLYHERSFYVPPHRSEPELLKGQKAEPEFWQRSTHNFIDGNPERLGLATCVPLPEDSKTDSRYKRYKHVDSIIIDTTTWNHTIERVKKNNYGLSSAPTSYLQRSKGYELYSTPNSDRLPLIQQLNFVGNYDFTWLIWGSDNSAMTGGINYAISGYGSTDEFRINSQWADPFHYGLQRNLKDGKMVWVRPKGEYVGIYEKAQRWFDKDAALKHPEFEDESVIHDRTGDEFHLVQVIQEETPVYSISLPHTPVYLKDKDGNEIRGCLGYPPNDATAHLRSKLDYPRHLDAIALGFDQTLTNNRCSLYKQLQEKLSEYHPDLLIHQQNSLTPTQRATYRKTILYPEEEVIMPYGTDELRVIAAHRVLKGLVRSLPPLE